MFLNAFDGPDAAQRRNRFPGANRCGDVRLGFMMAAGILLAVVGLGIGARTAFRDRRRAAGGDVTYYDWHHKATVFGPW
jgi:hypothetical protein